MEVVKATVPCKRLYTDLSSQNIVVCPHFNALLSIVHLNLSNNRIDSIESLIDLPHLWDLNLNNNRLRSLDGIRNFVALSSLRLGSNKLTWSDLGKIRHMHIAQLELHGNAALKKEKYYREHLLDIFPNVWCLDGIFASSAERIRNLRFFQRSAMGPNPARHKFRKDVFIPSGMKNRRVQGVFGPRAVKLLLAFPDEVPLTGEWDSRKLQHFSRYVQEFLQCHEQTDQTDGNFLEKIPTYLEDIVTQREESEKNNEHLNILLLLLLASLEFSIPEHLLVETLEAVALSTMGEIETMDLFLIPSFLRLQLVQVLLAAAKLDLEKDKSSLYSELFTAYMESISRLLPVVKESGPVQPAHRRYLNRSIREMEAYKCILAAELTFQLCAVPAFYEVLLHEDVLTILTVATGDVSFPERLIGFARQKEVELQNDVLGICNAICTYLSEEVNHHISHLLQEDVFIPKSGAASGLQSCSLRPLPQPLYSSEYLVRGKTPPSRRPPVVTSASPPKQRQPALGDEILIGPQNVARIISIPESKLILIQMYQIPEHNGGMRSVAVHPREHYAYVDMDRLEWDKRGGRWRPRGVQGDRITFKMPSIGVRELLSAASPLTPVPISSVPASAPPGRRGQDQQESNQRASTALGQVKPQLLYRPLSARFLSSRMSGSSAVPFPTTTNTREIKEIKESLVDAEAEGSYESAGRTTPVKDVQNGTGEEVVHKAENDREEAGKQSEDEPYLSENVTATMSQTFLTQQDTEEINLETKPSTDLKAETESKPVKINLNKEPITDKENAPEDSRMKNQNDRKPKSAAHITFLIPNENSPGRTISHLSSPRGSGPVGSLQMTVYQKQRTDSWKASKSESGDTPRSESVVMVQSPSRSSVPPLARPESSVWLGQGRDLHEEDRQKHPHPRHVPGWKEGLNSDRQAPSWGTGVSHRAASAALLYDCYCRRMECHSRDGSNIDLRLLSSRRKTESELDSDRSRISNALGSRTPDGAMCFKCQASHYPPHMYD